MNGSKCWYRFPLTTDDALSSIGLELVAAYTEPNISKMWKNSNLEVFNRDFLDYFKSMNVEVASSLFFYRVPHYVRPMAHVDMANANKPIIVPMGLNFVVTPDDDSDMIWYETPNYDLDSSKLIHTTAGTFHISANVNELTEIDRHCIGNRLTLVRTDLLHNVIMRQSPRFCISLRLVKNPGNWQQCVEYFEKFLE